MTQVRFYIEELPRRLPTPMGVLAFDDAPHRGDLVFLEGRTHSVVDRGWRLTLDDQIECHVLLRHVGRGAWRFADPELAA